MSEKTRPSFLDFVVSFDRAISEKDFTANEQLLYITLLCINNGYRWSETFSKSDIFLMDRMKIGRKAFHAARNGLKQKGLINFTPSKRRGSCTQYQIIDSFCTYQRNTQRDIQRDTQRDTQKSNKGAVYKEKRNKMEDINNIPPISPKGEIAAVIENYTDNGELQKALQDFIAMRKSIKKPITARGLELAIKKLDTLATSDRDRLAVVNQSVMNSWQGLFPLKNTAKANTSAPDDNDWSDEEYARVGW